MPIIPDRLDRTTVERLFANRDFGLIRRLPDHEGVGAVIISDEEIRCSLATEIAVDALLIHVVGSGNIVRESVGVICHREDTEGIPDSFNESARIYKVSPATNFGINRVARAGNDPVSANCLAARESRCVNWDGATE